MKQERLLKNDILDILSKQVSGGNDKAKAQKTRKPAKAKAKAKAKPAKKQAKDELKKQQELYGEFLDARMYNMKQYLKGEIKTEEELEDAIDENEKDYFELSDRFNTPSNSDPIAQSAKNKKKIVALKKLLDKQNKKAKQPKKAKSQSINLVIKEKVKSSKKKKGTYKDTPANRKMNRVGLEFGTIKPLSYRSPAKAKSKVEKKPTHTMKDGAVHTGKKHTKDSKVVKPAKSKPKTKKNYGTTAPVCETKKGKFQKCNPWIEHVKDFRFNNNVEGMSVAQVNKEAKKSYTPVSKSKSKAPKKAPAKEKKIYTQKRRKELISKDKARRDTKKKELLEDLRKASQMLDNSTDPNIIEEATEFLRKTQAELEKLNKTKKSTKKCPIGKKRNPDSGRCKKIVCPSGKELNEKSGRCNKYKFTKEDKEIFKFIGEEEDRLNKKSPKKKREPTAWDLHLKQIRLENPSIKGKAIMKMASESYSKGGQCKSKDKEPTKPVDKQDFLDQTRIFHPDKNSDCVEEANEKFIRLQKLYEEDDKDDIKNNEKILAEIFDNIDIFTNEFENIFNDDEMNLDEKQNKFKEIIFKIEQYTEYLKENYNDLDAGSKIRIGYALEKTEEKYLESYRLLQDFKPKSVLEFSDDEEDLEQIREDIEEEEMDKILQEALFKEEEPLFNPEFAYKPAPVESDFLPDYLLKQSPEFQTNPSNYPYDSILKYDSVDKEPEVEIVRSLVPYMPKIKFNFDTTKFNNLSVLDDKIYKSLYKKEPERNQEPSIQLLLEDKPKKNIKFTKKIDKKQTPLNLRLYQSFYKILKKNNPQLNRPDIIKFWKTNKESYIDMLMYSIDKVGGNLEDHDNYVNMFNFIGGNLSLFKGSDNYSENKIPTTDDLLNVDNWTNTVENIATSVYDTLEDVFDFIF